MTAADTAPPGPARRMSRLQKYLRQLVYGGNDGIVTTFATVAGFAGFAGTEADGVAQIGGVAVLVFGLANLFADGVSMGLGEYLSGHSEDELHARRRQAELAAITQDPEGESRATAGMLAARGLPAADAARIAEILRPHPGMMADLRMAYAGMFTGDGDNPAVNGGFTFLSFLAFGFVPLIPYVLMEPTQTTFYWSLAATFTSLFALGLLRWRATEERFARSVGETMTVGAVCAAVAFLVGRMVGG